MLALALAASVSPSAALAYVPSETLARAAEEPVWCWSDAEWEPYRDAALAFYAVESGSVERGVHMPARTAPASSGRARGGDPSPASR